MKKILFIGAMLVFCANCAFSAPKEFLYVVKDNSSENLINIIKENFTNMSITNANADTLYLQEDDKNFYYIKAYNIDKNTELYVKTNNSKMPRLIEQLPVKTYQLDDESTIKKYNNDFILYAKENNLKSVKVKKEKTRNSTGQTYKPYKGRLRNKVLETTLTEENNIVIERKKLKAKCKVKHYTYAYEYLITNNTEKDIIIENVASEHFIGLNQIAAYTLIPRGMDFVPIWGIVYGVQTDLEKNKFTRPHPQNETIKAGETMRILALAKLAENPVADFNFISNNKNIKITVK